MACQGTLQKSIIAVMVAGSVCACNGAGHSGGAAPPPASTVTGPGPEPAVRETPRRPRPTPPPKPSLVSRFRFAEQLPLGHLRSSGLLIDFGTKARHKYTLGDWKSGFQGDIADGRQTYSYVSSNKAHFYFFAFDDEAGGGSIAFRARREGADKARIYLNGEYVGTIPLADGFSHGVVTFDKGILPGHNEVRIATNGKRNTPHGIRAAFALDYVRVTPAEDQGGPAASTYDTPEIENAASNRADLLLTDGETLTYYLPVPKGGRIKGAAWRRIDKEKAKLSVYVRADGPKPPITVEEEIGATQSNLDIDLSAFEGAVAEVSFRAMSGSLVLHDVALYSAAEVRHKAPGKPSAKNFVLVLIDTLRADKLAPYNRDTRVRTAYLAAFAKEAMVFDRALAPENWTKPSVASLLTGLFPSTHNTKGDRDVLPSTVRIMPEYFKSLGFVTAGFVANGYVSGKFGFERGWDTWTNYVREGKPNRAEFVVADAIDWLEHRTDDKPFFLYVHTIDPHVPYIPPMRYLKMYDVGPYSGPVEAKTTAKLAEQIKTGGVTLNDRDKMRFEALYDGEITYHDDQLVHLQEKLKELGLLDDTLIVITSDHGEEFFDHGSAGHGHSLYEELLHVPLFVRLPGAEKSGDDAICQDEEEASLVDVFPTACEILGIECPAELEGATLLGRLRAETPAAYPSAAFSEFLTGSLAVRMGRYKLIYRGLRTSVFDLKRDPKETADLTEELPITFMALRDSLGTHLGRFVDALAASSPSGEAVKSARPQHKPEKAIIDAETKKQLKALGYMGGE